MEINSTLICRGVNWHLDRQRVRLRRAQSELTDPGSGKRHSWASSDNSPAKIQDFDLPGRKTTTWDDSYSNDVRIGSEQTVGQARVAFQSPFVGTWEADGDRRGRFIAVQLLSDASGAFLGSVTLEGSPVVSEDGQTFVDDGSTVMVTIRDPLGNIAQQLPGAGTPHTPAIRMTLGNAGFPQGDATAATPTS